MKRFSSLMLFRRVELLERAYGVGYLDEGIDVLLWRGADGGLFGHCHLCIYKPSGKTEWTACSEEEELALMRKSYEDNKHKIFGKGEPVAFWQYLEAFCYLGPAKYEDRRREVIEMVKANA